MCGESRMHGAGRGKSLRLYQGLTYRYRVPVSRTAYPQVRTAYTQFLFKEAEELAQDAGGNFE